MTRKISKITKRKSKFTKKSYICKIPKSQTLESKITKTNAQNIEMSSMLPVSVTYNIRHSCVTVTDSTQNLRNAGGLENLDITTITYCMPYLHIALLSF